MEAALSIGASDLRIMALDILPNVLAPIIVCTSLLIPSFVVLSRPCPLGLGVPPTPTWGGMLSDSVTYYRQAWWYVVFPGVALLTTTLAFNPFRRQHSGMRLTRGPTDSGDDGAAYGPGSCFGAPSTASC